jgi:hypothetical protein
MRKYKITLTGKSPLLMHYDNLGWADVLNRFRAAPPKDFVSVKGDDRSPSWTWIGSLYTGGEPAVVALPVDNIMRCAMEGAAMVSHPKGGAKTFKQESQSGMLPTEISWPLLVHGKQIPFAPVWALREDLDFEKHQALTLKMGFELYVKRARIGASKHVRVRPRFNTWSCTGLMDVWDSHIIGKDGKGQVLAEMFRLAGDHKGLGDWRPSSKTPGPFGRFSATVEQAA